MTDRLGRDTSMAAQNAQPDSSNKIFIARQPIFRGNGRVFGYELLFRSGLDNFFDSGQDGDEATSKVITNTFSLIGISKIIILKKLQNLFPRTSPFPISCPSMSIRRPCAEAWW